MTRRRGGAGRPTITAAGSLIMTSAGAGWPATSGARPGCNGVAATATPNMSGGRHCPLTRSSSRTATSRGSGFSCAGGTSSHRRIASVILPIRQYDVFIRQTVIVNRTVVIRDRFAVNPGIAPNIIAKFSGRPLRTFDVRPVVLAGTAQIPGALQVRAQDVRSSNFRAQTTVRQTQNIVRAADRVQAPQPLAAGERGRLGDNPPRAAQGRPSTTGQAPGAREQQPQQGQQQQQRQQQGQNSRRNDKRNAASRSRRRPRDAAESNSGNRRRPSVVGPSSASSGSSPAAKRSSRSKRREPKVAAQPNSGNRRRPSAVGPSSASSGSSPAAKRSSRSKRREPKVAAQPNSGNRRRPSAVGSSSGSSPAAKRSSRSKRREPKVAAEPRSGNRRRPSVEALSSATAVAADRVRRHRSRAASPASPRVAAAEEQAKRRRKRASAAREQARPRAAAAVERRAPRRRADVAEARAAPPPRGEADGVPDSRTVLHEGERAAPGAARLLSTLLSSSVDQAKAEQNFSFDRGCCDHCLRVNGGRQAVALRGREG